MNFVSRTEKKINEDAIAIVNTIKRSSSNTLLINQDIFNDLLDENPNLWIVADGASGLTKADHMQLTSDAAWFSHFLCQYLALHNDESKTLSKLLEEACLCAKSQFPSCPEIEQPSCALAILRKNESKHCFDYLVLGDCVLFLKVNSKENQQPTYLKISDDRIAYFDQLAIDEMARLAKQKNETMFAQRPFVQSILIHNRNMKNKADGYAIADLSADWLNHEIAGSIPYDQLLSAALYSDGFDQLQSFLNLSDHQFGDHLFSHDANFLIDQLFNQQELDANCSLLPRLKKRDDTSLIVI